MRCVPWNSSLRLSHLLQVLVLGMGAGMIPLYVSTVIPNAQIVAVEMDPWVIAATKQCFFEGR